jgi:hypothetical protein
MAAWLDEHREYEVTACNYAMFRGSLEDQRPVPVTQPHRLPDEPYWLENFLLCETHTAVWLYMSRRPYADRILGTFCTKRKRTYEPLIAIPLASGGGKLKYFPEALYKFNLYANGFIAMASYEQAKAYYKDYNDLHRWVIEKLNVEKKEKERLMLFGGLGCLKKLIEYARIFDADKEEILPFLSDIRYMAQKLYPVIADVSNEKIILMAEYFFRAIEYAFLNDGHRVAAIQKPKGRVIGLGALGKAAKKRICLLRGSVLQPSVLWDAVASEDSVVDGIAVTPPAYNTLTADDVVLVFPLKESVIEELKDRLEGRTAANIMWNPDIEEAVSVICFPSLYHKF